MELEVIIALERGIRTVNRDDTLTERAAEFLEQMTREVNHSVVAIGTGSPEGSVTARPGKMYMDDSGSAGNILYIKKTGTGKAGWILV